MLFAGIDAGSRAIKIVFVDENKKIRANGILDQGVEQNRLAKTLYQSMLDENGFQINDILFSIGTGYGRDNLDFTDTTVTEITCHAIGVLHLHPEVKTIIDIGGQDSKVIRLENGKVRDFVMNDRCAAGTGRFLEVVARRLETPIHKLGDLSKQAEKPAVISSMCVVFAETEIIGLLASGELKENIVAGVETAIASRISTMLGPRLAEPVYFTGGVAKIPGMDKSLSRKLNHNVTVSMTPQLTGALGAAILALEKCRDS